MLQLKMLQLYLHINELRELCISVIEVSAHEQTGKQSESQVSVKIPKIQLLCTNDEKYKQYCVSAVTSASVRPCFEFEMLLRFMAPISPYENFYSDFYEQLRN